jgi:hypothetical protein
MPAVTNTYSQLHCALMQVSLQIQPVVKGVVHADTGAAYATLDQIQAALEPALRAANLVLLPDFHLAYGILNCAVTVVNVPFGESYTARLPVVIDATQPWTCAAGVTTGRRLLLAALFNIRCVDDPIATRAGPAGRAVAAGCAGSAGRAGAPAADAHADRTVTPGTPDEVQTAHRAVQDLTTMWIAASRRLGIGACTALLTREFQVASLADLPPASIPMATAAMRRAMQQAEGEAHAAASATAPEPAGGDEHSAAPATASSAAPADTCACAPV